MLLGAAMELRSVAGRAEVEGAVSCFRCSVTGRDGAGEGLCLCWRIRVPRGVLKATQPEMFTSCRL